MASKKEDLSENVAADPAKFKGLHKEERPKLDYQAFVPAATLFLWR